MTQPTREELVAWSNSRCTKFFVEELKQKKQETMEAWAKQAFVVPNNHQETLGLNSNALGGIDVLRQLIDIIEEIGAENGE